jgi:hypothetical protein
LNLIRQREHVPWGGRGTQWKSELLRGPTIVVSSESERRKSCGEEMLGESTTGRSILASVGPSGFVSPRQMEVLRECGLGDWDAEVSRVANKRRIRWDQLLGKGRAVRGSTQGRRVSNVLRNKRQSLLAEVSEYPVLTSQESSALQVVIFTMFSPVCPFDIHDGNLSAAHHMPEYGK